MQTYLILSQERKDFASLQGWLFLYMNMRDREHLAIALRMLGEGLSYSYITNKTGLSYKTLRRIESIQRLGGVQAVLSPRNRYYQPAEKAKAAIDVLNGRAVAEVAAEFGATEHSVRRWVDRYRQGGADALKDGRVQKKGGRQVSADEYDFKVQSTTNKN